MGKSLNQFTRRWNLSKSFLTLKERGVCNHTTIHDVFSIFTYGWHSVNVCCLEYWKIYLLYFITELMLS